MKYCNAFAFLSCNTTDNEVITNVLEPRSNQIFNQNWFKETYFEFLVAYD